MIDLFSGQTAVLDAPSPAPSPPSQGRGVCNDGLAAHARRCAQSHRALRVRQEKSNDWSRKGSSRDGSVGRSSNLVSLW